ncbi:MAG TPA: hypothetical protein VHK22_04040 [Gaiellaceae bacterium]|jgi:hypothetical protein|nr:hypothetical protein [Gaiellaceae bacterium]
MGIMYERLSGSSSTSSYPSGSLKAALVRRTVFGDLDDPRDGLLLEPLTRVAGMDARRLGELPRAVGPSAREDAVEAEPVAEVDGE